MIFKTLIACLRMLKDCFCAIFWFGGVGGKMHVFEMANFWIDVFRADDLLTMFASRLESEIHKMVRKLTIRVIIVFTGFE